MARAADNKTTRHFAFVGDVHGMHHFAFDNLRALEAQLSVRFEAVFQVGDFEAHESEDSLRTMSGPQKHKRVGDFADYHTGKSAVPWPVYFIGGNHEPWPRLDELGSGEVAPNISFIGRAGVVDVAGFRVAGLSGIFDAEAYDGERPGPEQSESVSNKDYIWFREADVDQLLDECVTCPPHVLLVHDWPDCAIAPDDLNQLYQTSPRVRRGYRGNRVATDLVELLRPEWVFAGHMHTRYERALSPQTRFVGLDHARAGERAMAVLKVTAASITQIY